MTVWGVPAEDHNKSRGGGGGRSEHPNPKTWAACERTFCNATQSERVSAEARGAAGGRERHRNNSVGMGERGCRAHQRCNNISASVPQVRACQVKALKGDTRVREMRFVALLAAALSATVQLHRNRVTHLPFSVPKAPIVQQMSEQVLLTNLC